MTYRVLHVIPHIFMCRAHASFHDNEKFQHFYIMPKYSPRKDLVLLETGDQIIKSKNKFNVHCDTRGKNITKALNRKSIDMIIKKIREIKPHFTILTDPNLRPIQIFDELLKWGPIYWINHGTYNMDTIVFLNSKKRLNNYNWSRFKGAFITKKEETYLFSMNEDYVKKGKIHVINGLTQIDYLMELDLDAMKKKVYQAINPKNGCFTSKSEGDGLPLSKRSILFIQNVHVKYDGGKQSKEFELIMKELVPYATKHGIHLFVKIKHMGIMRKMGDRHQALKSLDRNPNVTLISSDINSELYSYHFMWCDVMVVENYGTCLQEGLSFKPETIRCQFLMKDNVAYLDEFNLLPQAFDQKSLVRWLDNFLFKHDEVVTPEYEAQRMTYRNTIFGDLQRVTDDILERIVVDLDRVIPDENQEDDNQEDENQEDEN